MALISMVIGLLTAFFVYNDARKGGRGSITALLWAVASVAMPIVIVPLYFLVGRKTRKQDAYDHNDIIDIEATVVEETSHTLQLPCKSCGKLLNEEWKGCPYCQAPIEPQ